MARPFCEKGDEHGLRFLWRCGKICRIKLEGLDEGRGLLKMPEERNFWIQSQRHRSVQRHERVSGGLC